MRGSREIEVRELKLEADYLRLVAQPVPVAPVLVVSLAAASFLELLAAAGFPPLPVAGGHCDKLPVVAVVGSGVVGSHCLFLTCYESRLATTFETVFSRGPILVWARRRSS